MAAIRSLQRAFAGGVLTPEFFGQIEDAKYQTGLVTCRNFIIKPHGPVANRPGTRFVLEVKNSAQTVKLIPFIYSTTQTMCLEVGQNYIRFHTQGGTLLDPVSGLPYEIATPYVEADLFDLHYVQSDDILTITHENYPPSELRRLGATNWTLTPIQFASVLAAPTNLVATATTAGSGGTAVAMNYVVTAVDSTGIEEGLPSNIGTCNNNIFGTGAVNTLTWSAVNGAIRYNVYRQDNGLYGFLGQTDQVTFLDTQASELTPDLSQTPPIQNTPFTAGGITSVNITSGGGGYTSSNIGYTVTTSTGSGFVGTPVVVSGVLTGFTVVYPGQNYAPTDTITITGGGSATKATGTFTFSKQPVANQTIIVNGVTWTFVASGAGTARTVIGSTLAATLLQLAVDLNASTNTSINIATYTANTSTNVLAVSFDTPGTGGNVFTLGKGTAASAVSGTTLAGGTNSGTATATPVIGSQTGNYPGAVSYFQQRRDFGGTPLQPQNLWMTRTGTESNLSYSIPTHDDDSIAFKISATQANAIRHFVPLQSLIVLTSSAEYRITSINSDAITPSSVSVTPQSFVGASMVQPVIAKNNLIFVADRGGHWNEMAYAWQANGYLTQDIALRAPNLFDGFDTVDMALAKCPYPLIFGPRSDGQLIGMTYVPEQQINAFHSHDTYTAAGQSVFESICIVPEGVEDAIYVSVARVIGGVTKRYIECFANQLNESRATAYHVDCGITYSGTPISAITGGLSHLIGETVSILADGLVQPQQVVNSSGGLDKALPFAATNIQIGLQITSDLQTLPLAFEAQAFGQGRQKNVNKVYLRVSNSAGILAGPTFDKLVTARVQTVPPTLLTDEVPIPLTPSWTNTGQMCVRQTDPLPLTIVCLSLEAEIGG